MEKFRELLQKDEDRQAVRAFRFLFQQFIQSEKLQKQEELIIALGILNMIALSELGRNEKNYIPDVNAMVNSL